MNSSNKDLFNQQFCVHFFSLKNQEENGLHAKCENGCKLEWGQVLQWVKNAKN